MAKKYIDNKRRRIGYSDPNEPCWIAKNVKILLFRSLKKIRQKVGGGWGDFLVYSFAPRLSPFPAAAGSMNLV